MFQKILIANRGEIAVRIIRACRELGIRTVAVYSEADREALHTQLADEAVCIGPASSLDSYLSMERILSATIAAKADAIHPGFGFLSESSKFARMCQKCKITFIGPSAEVIHKMGNKSEARLTMMEAGVPVVPGTREPVYDVHTGERIAEQIGYPVMIKASSGGGGKGMRIAESNEDFAENFQTAQMESVRAFGDDTMYIERYIKNPKHIEFQIIADKFGNVVQLGERDCSVQRNHQKMIEESPCAVLTRELRKKMGDEAIRAARAAGYENAGTIEFLLENNEKFYFIEMNTRIQVEHPVTEMVSGVDLIKEQIHIAAGLPLSVKQEEIQLQGHSIECRINAENPAKNFMPCPGTVREVHLPGGFGVRIDTAVYNGYEIPPYYDSMIAKVIVHDKTRIAALNKMRSTLGELIIDGVTSNIDFLYEILNSEEFQKGEFSTAFIEEHFS